MIAHVGAYSAYASPPCEVPALRFVDLVQIQMLSPIDHFARRTSRGLLILRRPRHDRYGGHCQQRKNHHEPNEIISFRCHLFPSWQQTKVARADCEDRIGGRNVSYFTLRISIILMETIKDLYKRLLDHHPGQPHRDGRPLPKGTPFLPGY